MKAIITIGLLVAPLFIWTACQPPASSDTTTTELVPKDTLPPLDTMHQMKLIFVGDIMGHTNQIRSAVGDPKQFKSKDQTVFNYEPVFRYVAPILRQADYAVGNLELTLSRRGNYRGYPMFKTPDALAPVLKDAGFDLLSTCNNHSNDGYSYGLKHTIEVLDSLGIAHTGTFIDTAAYDSLYPLLVEKEVDGTVFRLVFLSYTYSTNGVETPSPFVVNGIDHDQIRRDVAKAKAMNPDFIIALMHWGREYQLLPYKTERETARILEEAGVNAIIGGHPHVIQPVEVDTIHTADSSAWREVLVTYSLGNFVSNQYRLNTDLGLMVELELVKNSRQNTTVLGTHHYLPVWRYIQGRYNKALKKGFEWKYTVLPVSVFERGGGKQWVRLSAKDSADMAVVTQRFRSHLDRYAESSERTVDANELGALRPFLPHSNDTIAYDFNQ